MANFSLRTLSHNVGQRYYKIHIRAEDKELRDFFDRLCEKLETSNIDQEYRGPFSVTVRRMR